jgi:predicted transcriptional regulator
MSINTPAPSGPAPAVPPYPAASPAAARARVRRLHRAGITYQAIAIAAGLDPGTVRDLAHGRRHPVRGTTAAVLAMKPETIPPTRLDAGGTRLRLRALHVMGHGSARIARALGVREMTIRRLTRGDATTVSLALRDAVTDLYDAWWDKRAPEQNRAERGAATAARRRAIAGNWCAGAGLDDDELDTPGYKPASKWKPATGTGTAPDINPSPRPDKTRRPTPNANRAADGSAAGKRTCCLSIGPA